MDKEKQHAATPASVLPSARVPIVSSLHLALGRSAELSEFEFGLIIASNAFNRWAVRCIAASGMKDMTITDVLVLHLVNDQARERKLADVAFMLNIEDTHIVNYSLKKLMTLGLVQTRRHGKEVLYSTNERGRDVCKRYFEIREQVLVSGLSGDGSETLELTELAGFLRVLSGLYDQAARSAASL